MNFIDIVNKHGYSDEFASFLGELYKELVNIFKDEELVYNALMEVKIVSCDNVYDYLEENSIIDEEDKNIVSDSDLKVSSGVYSFSYEIGFDSLNNTYYMKRIKRIVAIKDLNLNSVQKKSTLIHEVCHLIKSYYNEYIILDDELIVRNGLIEVHYKLKHENGKVIKTLIKEVGVGLEEGLNSVLEEDITRKIVSKDYVSYGYKGVNQVSKNFISLNGLEEVVKNAQLYHDKNELYEILGFELYAKFENMMDKLYKLQLEIFSSAFMIEERNKYIEEYKLIINNEYPSIWSEIENKVNNKMSF